MKKINLDSLYKSYLAQAGISNTDLMSKEEQVERKRSFMAGVWFFNKFITDNLTRLTSAKAGELLRDTEKQLRRFWKEEYDRIEEEGREPMDWDNEVPGE